MHWCQGLTLCSSWAPRINNPFLISFSLSLSHTNTHILVHTRTLLHIYKHTHTHSCINTHTFTFTHTCTQRVFNLSFSVSRFFFIDGKQKQLQPRLNWGHWESLECLWTIVMSSHMKCQSYNEQFYTWGLKFTKLLQENFQKIFIIFRLPFTQRK